MSIRYQMRQAASRGGKTLGRRGELVVQFFRQQWYSDGGFKGRAELSDLYYTMFGVEAMLALGAELPVDSLRRYLSGFSSGEKLDLVHLACLIRCWTALPKGCLSEPCRGYFQRHLAGFRSKDGGFRMVKGIGQVSSYGCFLGLGAYQDLEVELPDAKALVESLQTLRTNDGGYANQPDMTQGLTTATAAVMIIKYQLQEPIGDRLPAWLGGQKQPGGGFKPMAAAPIADLLSTATAIYALTCHRAYLEEVKRDCQSYLDGLWDERGGYHGHELDETIDGEYTYYGLLTQGFLSDTKNSQGG